MSIVSHVAIPVQKLGAAFYFDAETVARGRALGLGGRRFYFLGRGGTLGDVEWPLVASAFGYFNPALIEQIWTSSVTRMQPKDAGRAYVECSQDYGRAHFTDVPDLDAFCAAAEAVNASIDPTGLALYAGLSSAPLAQDLAARAYQLITLLREHRGSAHLLAVVAVGLAPRVAHAIRRPDDLEAFGWTPEDIPPITDGDRARLDEAERLTDRLVAPAYAGLDESSQDALRLGLSRMRAALSRM